jgi:hypothetical protein
MWWTDLFGGTYHDDKIIELLAQLKNIDNRATWRPIDVRQPRSLSFSTSRAFTYFGDGEPLFNALLTAQKQWEFAFMGAPWDPYLLSDMGNPNLRDYKLYIFLNTFHATPAQREAVHQRLKRNGATAVWVYAPGYIQNNVSVDNIEALTGIQVGETDTAGELRVDISSFDTPYTKGLPNPTGYRTDVNVENIKRYYDHQLYL